MYRRFSDRARDDAQSFFWRSASQHPHSNASAHAPPRQRNMHSLAQFFPTSNAPVSVRAGSYSSIQRDVHPIHGSQPAAERASNNASGQYAFPNHSLAKDVHPPQQYYAHHPGRYKVGSYRAAGKGLANPPLHSAAPPLHTTVSAGRSSHEHSDGWRSDTYSTHPSEHRLQPMPPGRAAPLTVAAQPRVDPAAARAVVAASTASVQYRPSSASTGSAAWPAVEHRPVSVETYKSPVQPSHQQREQALMSSSARDLYAREAQQFRRSSAGTHPDSKPGLATPSHSRLHQPHAVHMSAQGNHVAPQQSLQGDYVRNPDRSFATAADGIALPATAAKTPNDEPSDSGKRKATEQGTDSDHEKRRKLALYLSALGIKATSMQHNGCSSKVEHHTAYPYLRADAESGPIDPRLQRRHASSSESTTLERQARSAEVEPTSRNLDSSENVIQTPQLPLYDNVRPQQPRASLVSAPSEAQQEQQHGVRGQDITSIPARDTACGQPAKQDRGSSHPGSAVGHKINGRPARYDIYVKGSGGATFQRPKSALPADPSSRNGARTSPVLGESAACQENLVNLLPSKDEVTTCAAAADPDTGSVSHDAVDGETMTETGRDGETMAETGHDGTQDVQLPPEPSKSVEPGSFSDSHQVKSQGSSAREKELQRLQFDHPGVRSVCPDSIAKSTWDCPRCTLVNEGGVTCGACGLPRPRRSRDRRGSEGTDPSAVAPSSRRVRAKRNDGSLFDDLDALDEAIQASKHECVSSVSDEAAGSAPSTRNLRARQKTGAAISPETTGRAGREVTAVQDHSPTHGGDHSQSCLSCGVCEKQFTTRTGLLQHLKSKSHRDQVEASLESSDSATDSNSESNSELDGSDGDAANQTDSRSPSSRGPISSRSGALAYDEGTASRVALSRSPSPLEPEAGQVTLKKGAHVLAKYAIDGFWYPGRVSDRKSTASMIAVDFADGDAGSVSRQHVVWPPVFPPGWQVFVKTRNMRVHHEAIVIDADHTPSGRAFYRVQFPDGTRTKARMEEVIAETGPDCPYQIRPPPREERSARSSSQSSPVKMEQDESEPDLRCGVCGHDDPDQDGILCDGCDVAFHLKCVDLSSIPRGKWFCRNCSQPKRRKKTKLLKQRPSAANSLEQESVTADQESFDQDTCDAMADHFRTCLAEVQGSSWDCDMAAASPSQLANCDVRAFLTCSKADIDGRVSSQRAEVHALETLVVETEARRLALLHRLRQKLSHLFVRYGNLQQRVRKELPASAKLIARTNLESTTPVESAACPDEQQLELSKDEFDSSQSMVSDPVLHGREERQSYAHHTAVTPDSNFAVEHGPRVDICSRNHSEGSHGQDIVSQASVHL